MNDTHATDSPVASPGMGQPPHWGPIQGKLALVALVGIGIFVAGAILRGIVDGKSDIEELFAAYLVGFIFWLSLPLGSLALLCVQYLAGGRWGILLRRILEANTRTLPLMAVLFIPIGINYFMKDSSIYWWANTLPTESSGLPSQAVEELNHKASDYLNPSFGIVRAVLLFAIWGTLIWVFNRWAQRLEETGSLTYREKLKNFAGPAAMLFGIFTMFAATDWVMSLEEAWSSTMFPVIFVVNALLTTFAFCIVVFLTLARGNHFPVKHTKQDQLNLGSFMLAFTIFWSYIAFSQFLLVWSGNLPEEIAYYLKRSREGWQVMVTALALFHFACPFLLLLFRGIKESIPRLRAVAIGIMIICAVDVFWWIGPSRSHDGQVMFWLLYIGSLIGIGGIWGWMFIRELSRKTLLPTHEAKWLEEDHHHGHE